MKINPRAVFLMLGVGFIVGGIFGVPAGFIAAGVSAVASALVH